MREPAPNGRGEDEKLGLAAFRRPPESAGLSLDQLTAAFAEMLSAGDDPYAVSESADMDDDPTATAVDPTSAPVAGGAEDAAADDTCQVTPRTILEAMLFVGGAGGAPLTSQQVASLMRGVRPAEIDTLVRELNAGYAARNCPYEIVAEQAGYRLRLTAAHRRVRDRFYGKARQARLSQAAIEVLAAVAYHTSLSAEEVAEKRGSASGAILAQLVRRRLLRLERGATRSERARYYTTDRFLQLFGLESLEDLPRSPELEMR